MFLILISFQFYLSLGAQLQPRSDVYHARGRHKLTHKDVCSNQWQLFLYIMFLVIYLQNQSEKIKMNYTHYFTFRDVNQQLVKTKNTIYVTKA